MYKILFICHGNICRSPMAEFVMKDLVKRAGRESAYFISSAAVSAEELGNPVYPPARRTLQKHGIDCAGKRARQTTASDAETFDRIVCMDDSNLVFLRRIYGEEGMKKVSLLLSYAKETRNVEDPWYTGDFETAYADVEKGCKALFAALEREGAQK